MRAHGETIARAPRVGMAIEVSSLDWFQRVYQWFKSLTAHHKDIPAVSPYGTWDPRRERFDAFKAEAALDMVATRNGVAWSTQIYSASI
jgi:hypothetical protein